MRFAKDDVACPQQRLSPVQKFFEPSPVIELPEDSIMTQQRTHVVVSSLLAKAQPIGFNEMRIADRSRPSVQALAEFALFLSCHPARPGNRIGLPERHDLQFRSLVSRDAEFHQKTFVE